MQSRRARSSAVAVLTLTLVALLPMIAEAEPKKGLNNQARKELLDAGVDKYLGEFTPASSEPFNQDWTKHTFDTDGGDGPICIGGTEYSVFSKQGDPNKLLIFLQGGGACWQDFRECNELAESQFPPPAEFLPGIFAESSPDGTIPNDLGTWSVVYLPYCDGSVFGGDNDVPDPGFPDGLRRHRGLRNLSAGMDVARDEFGKKLDKVLIAGSSAGGVGTAAFSPFLARFLFKKKTELYVFNDAGPLALNPEATPDAAAARAADWEFDQFYPQSCIDQGLCDAAEQQTGIIQWRLDNDSTVLESFYETDGDLTNGFFISSNVPGVPDFVPVSQSEYRDILDEEHGAINASHPDRYKRYIVSGGNPACIGFVVYSHTALQGGGGFPTCAGSDLYYDLEANGVPLYEWTNDFVNTSADDDDGGSSWVDNVEPFVMAPPLGP